MGVGEWISQNWFEIITSFCAIAGLWFSAFAIRKNAQAQEEETKARRVSNFIAITANFRETWKEFFHTSALARVIDPSADVTKQPVSPEEELFVGLVISQMRIVFYATNDELLIKLEGSSRDIAQFLSLPVPKAVWNATKMLQNHDFAAFVESSLKKF
jgi:hypothetical protein